MKVGVLTTSYPASEHDPSGHFVRGFAEWLRAHVGHVEVLALRGDDDPARRMRDGGLPAQLGVGRAARISAQLCLAAARRARRWDAVVSHWLVPSAAVAALVAPKRYHLAIAHGSDVALLRNLPLGPHLVRRLAARADLVYVADALRIPGAAGRVVAMPAEHAASPISDEERALARRSLGLPDDRTVALSLGRLVPEKGVDRLLRALPSHMDLIVAGEGPERGALELQARGLGPRVTFVGPRFGADKRALFAAADLLIVPSVRDGSPTVIAEARQVGLPIVATNVGGLPLAVADGGVCVDGLALRATLATWSAPATRTVRPVSWKEIGPSLWRGPLRDASSARLKDPSRLDVFTYASLR